MKRQAFYRARTEIGKKLLQNAAMQKQTNEKSRLRRLRANGAATENRPKIPIGFLRPPAHKRLGGRICPSCAVPQAEPHKPPALPETGTAPAQVRGLYFFTRHVVTKFSIYLCYTAVASKRKEKIKMRQETVYVSVSFQNGELLITPRGEIDHHAAKALREEMDKAIRRFRPGRVVLRMGSVGFMDSSGLGLIVGRLRTAKEVGATLVLREANGQCRRIFEMAGLARMPGLYLEDTPAGKPAGR